MPECSRKCLLVNIGLATAVPAAQTRISIFPNFFAISSITFLTASVLVTSTPQGYTCDASSSGTPSPVFATSRISPQACIATARSLSRTANERAPEIANAFRNSFPRPPKNYSCKMMRANVRLPSLKLVGGLQRRAPIAVFPSNERLGRTRREAAVELNRKLHPLRANLRPRAPSLANIAGCRRTEPEELHSCYLSYSQSKYSITRIKHFTSPKLSSFNHFVIFFPTHSRQAIVDCSLISSEEESLPLSLRRRDTQLEHADILN